MAFCPQCGERNPERARFCTSCGSRLPADPTLPLQVRKMVTVLFCDVTGSTSMYERHDPEQLRAILLRFYQSVRAVISRHGGTVEKFVGDAVMAAFGVPLLHEDDALRAVRAALDIRTALADINEELERQHGIRIDVRTGVNSGEVIAGDPTQRYSFVSGDAVNIAQRLQASAEPGEILIGYETYGLARDALRVELLPPLSVKGKEKPLTAFRLLEVYPGAPGRARRFDSPMVGREEERRPLRQVFERAVREATCHLLTVLGVAGVGKSRLVAEALQDVAPSATVLSGTCLPYGEGITFWPVLEVVRQAVGISNQDSPSEARAKIAAQLADVDDADAERVAERVAELLGMAEGAAVAHEGFWAVRTLLEALARRRPLVVVFDDLHWAEPTFLDLVEYVADWSRDAPILLVCMSRPELLDARPGWGGGKRNAVTMSLEPLSDHETELLIRNLLGEGAPEPGVLRRIQSAAEGNPLFVEEMLSVLVEDGLLVRQDGRWIAAGDASRLPVPATIQVLLASRLDRLERDERLTVERAAIEGHVFHRDAVEWLLDDGTRVSELLLSLVRKELIRPHRTTAAGEELFRFRHTLIREAAYESLPKQVRAQLHERFAEWLHRNAGLTEYEELIGYHLEQAFRYGCELARFDDHLRGLAQRAGDRLAAAGRRALRRGDISAAANLLGRAADILPDEDESRLPLLPELGAALRESGELRRADDVLQEAIDRARRVGSPPIEVSALIEQANLHLFRDPSAPGTDHLVTRVEEAAALLEKFGDDRLLAQVWTLIGNARGVWEGRFARGVEAFDRALSHARRAGDRRQEGIILARLAFAAQWGPTPVPEAIERCNEIAERAAGDRLIEAGAYRYLACLHARLGRFDEARTLATRAREGYEELGMRLTAEAVRAFSSADIELLAGDYAAAERQLRTAHRALEGMGERGHLSTVAAFLAAALYGQGRLDEAGRLARSAQESSGRWDIFSQVMSRGTRAKVAAHVGAPSEAVSLAREAVRLASVTDALELSGGALLDLAEVLRLAGRTEEAHASLEEALALFEQKGCEIVADQTRALLGEVEPGSVTTGEARAEREPTDRGRRPPRAGRRGSTAP